jgi:hydrogenase-4 component B
MDTIFGNILFQIDGLSILFALPVIIVSFSAFLFSRFYFPEKKDKKEWNTTVIFFPVLIFSILFLIVVRNTFAFIIGWEIMALSAFFLVLTEHKEGEVRKAANLYIVLTHLCTLFIIASIAIIYKITGSFNYPDIKSIDSSLFESKLLFVFIMAGFGLKAGLIPLHIWLPSTHASAPSHISAVMSGLLIKMGIYGILRFTSFFNTLPASWGTIIFILGVLSAILGVIFAIAQHDIKRLLAYHSIENIGIILMGIGLGYIGLSTNNTKIAVLGFAGSLLHIVNHALFKSLLFLGAGSVIKKTGTRDINKMGGLWSKIPFTFATFLVASAAISGLPPFNGFISELFIYLGMFNSTVYAHKSYATFVLLLGIPGLAIVGGLAAACFIKVNSIVFLGKNRNNDNLASISETAPLKIPLGLLAILCITIGIFPYIMKYPIETAITALIGLNVDLSSYFPFKEISLFNISLYTAFILGFILFKMVYRKKITYLEETWGCGYNFPDNRMQYTATSFSQIIVDIFKFLLRPERTSIVQKQFYPKKTSFHTHVKDLFLDGVYMPLLTWIDNLSKYVRKMQSGNLNLYILYVVAAMCLITIYGIVALW